MGPQHDVEAAVPSSMAMRSLIQLIGYRWLAASLGQLDRVAEVEQVLQHLQTTWPSSFDTYIRQRPRYCEHAPQLAGLRKELPWSHARAEFVNSGNNRDPTDGLA